MAELTITEAMRKTTLALKNYVDTNYQQKANEELLTNDKTVIGAINEIFTQGASTIEKEVFNAETHYDFPSVGSVDVIYKAYKEAKTYQWNVEKLTYEPLDVNESGPLSITMINGGNANGTN